MYIFGRSNLYYVMISFFLDLPKLEAFINS